MFEQRSEEGLDAPPDSEGPDEGQGAEARSADVYPCYSLEVLRLLED